MLVFVFLTLALTDVHEKGFQRVKVNLGTVLDGYSKEFTALLTYSDSHKQFLLWHESSAKKNFKQLLEPNSNYFLQLGLQDVVLGLPLQNFVPEVIVIEEENAFVLTLKSEVVKGSCIFQQGTTLKIKFLTPDFQDEQVHLLEQLEIALTEYSPLSFETFEQVALRQEGKYIKYIMRMHDEL